MVLTLSSRAHSPPLPSDATVMLIPNMHQDPLLMPKQRPSRLDDDDDLSDEPDPVLLESNFLEFFNETHDEFQSIGKVVQFKVCKNMTPHLRGNVYVQYATPEETAAAIQIFNGRFFAGMRLSCMAVPVPSWKAAICGTRQCPKGDLCNFLHVFRNPDRLYADADRDFEEYPRSDRRDERKNGRHDRNGHYDSTRDTRDSKDYSRDSRNSRGHSRRNSRDYYLYHTKDSRDARGRDSRDVERDSRNSGRDSKERDARDLRRADARDSKDREVRDLWSSKNRDLQRGDERDLKDSKGQKTDQRRDTTDTSLEQRFDGNYRNSRYSRSRSRSRERKIHLRSRSPPQVLRGKEPRETQINS